MPHAGMETYHLAFPAGGKRGGTHTILARTPQLFRSLARSGSTHSNSVGHPLNLLDVDALLHHLPQRRHLAQPLHVPHLYTQDTVV